MNADTMSAAIASTSAVYNRKKYKDGSEYAALWYAVVNRGGSRVLITKACASHEASDPRQ